MNDPRNPLQVTTTKPAKIVKNAIRKTETFRGVIAIFVAKCLCWRSPFGFAQAARLRGKRETS